MAPLQETWRELGRNLKKTQFAATFIPQFLPIAFLFTVSVIGSFQGLIPSSFQNTTQLNLQYTFPVSFWFLSLFPPRYFLEFYLRRISPQIISYSQTDVLVCNCTCNIVNRCYIVIRCFSYQLLLILAVIVIHQPSSECPDVLNFLKLPTHGQLYFIYDL